MLFIENTKSEQLGTTSSLSVHSGSQVQAAVVAAAQLAVGVDWRQVALEWGVSFKSVKRWIADGRDGRFPAEYLPLLCRRLANFGPLDCLEQEAGRIAVSLSDDPPPSRDGFRDLLRRALDDPRRKIDQKLLARRLGTDYRQLRYFVGHDPERRLPAMLLVPLCKSLEDYSLLDFIELQVGRLAFKQPEPHSPGSADIVDFHRLLETALRTVKTASESMSDNRLDLREAHLVISELDEVVRHSLRLRLWVKDALSRMSP